MEQQYEIWIVNNIWRVSRVEASTSHSCITVVLVGVGVYRDY